MIKGEGDHSVVSVVSTSIAGSKAPKGSSQSVTDELDFARRRLQTMLRNLL
jgi:hypothetical protein